MRRTPNDTTSAVPTGRRVLGSGERALLVEVDTLDDVLALHAALQATRPAGVVELVPAARTIMVVLDPHRIPLEAARAWIDRTEAVDTAPEATGEVTIDVDYSGEDLPGLARLLQLTPDELIDLHTASSWRVAFTGFAPGFAYLATDHDRLTVPRRDIPRTSVPAGSVGLAGEFSGVYPRSSPGGWQLIGTTDATLWDPDSAEPALLQPGCSVRFRRAHRE